MVDRLEDAMGYHETALCKMTLCYYLIDAGTAGPEPVVWEFTLFKPDEFC